MLRSLLTGLRSPYAYDVRRLHFDWQKGRWELVPEEPSPSEIFRNWIYQLVQDGDAGALENLRDDIDEAIDELTDGIEKAGGDVLDS